MSATFRHRSPAFTLIELLIVVAIIAILALIAVPNFMEAQTRAKVSRVHSELRTIATALEAYRVDYNNYPDRYLWGGPLSIPQCGTPEQNRYELHVLTTPTSYITSIPQDIFSHRDEHGLWPYDYLNMKVFCEVFHIFDCYWSNGRFYLYE